MSLRSSSRSPRRVERTGRDRTLEITIADTHDGIATTVVRSAVYREYLQLVRTEEGWRIVNALWALG